MPGGLSKQIQSSLIAALVALPTGEKPHLGSIRRSIAIELGAAVSVAMMNEAIQALRFQGKLHWERLELSASMLMSARHETSASAVGEGLDDPANAPDQVTPSPSWQMPAASPANILPEDGAVPANHADGDTPISPDASEGGAVDARTVPSSNPLPPPTKLKQVRASSVAAGRRLPPAPRHESEVQRAVREEVEQGLGRRRLAASTSTVCKVLDPTRAAVEGIQSALVESPGDLMVAIRRRHGALWDRVLQLARGRDERPAETLYAALERGLALFENETMETIDGA